MTKKSSKNESATSVNKQNSDIDDFMDDDSSLNEYIFHSREDDRASKKMAARRKIDIYMEKKRLREALDDFDYDDF